MEILKAMEGYRAYSAPGKALMAGGYLVLDPKYRAYVIALSARMHAVVRTIELKESDEFEINVSSSQFNGDYWCYMLCAETEYLPLEKNHKKNLFIEMVLVNVFKYFQPQRGGKIEIEIFSDHGYHSQSNSVTKRNAFKQFCYHGKSITEVPKTGLGSSAGLVVVLTTALISVFRNEMDLQNVNNLQLIHNLAQVAHCQAQGKVGSGFDVAAATFGSIVYRRFPPQLITSLPEHTDPTYVTKIQTLVDDTNWNISNARVSLPDGLKLVMGDVNSGSETTKLVSKVKCWYDSDPVRGLKVYQFINRKNEEIMTALTELNGLSRKDPDKYKVMLRALDQNEESKIQQSPEFSKIREAVQEVRLKFRQITQESGADIEPPVQTKLLEACSRLKGVLTGVIPGAGGYDAIALIVTAESNLQLQTEGRDEFAAVTWLDLHQEDVGVIEEEPLHYQNFIELT
ncbi:ERG8 (YMR220W) [Zygosaccharomyces parabailii]|nr:ERG8 (YMR220W) [Zygosaccharomyces parabailii]CDH10059.1 related to Phosphomevalonate kinase [Zygosaccharomyces bailii ISA1307]